MSYRHHMTGRPDRGSRWPTISRGGRSDRGYGRGRGAERFTNRVLDNRPPLTNNYRPDRQAGSYSTDRRERPRPLNDDLHGYSSREDDGSLDSSRRPSRRQSRESSRESYRLRRPSLKSDQRESQINLNYDSEDYYSRGIDRTRDTFRMHSLKNSEASSKEPSRDIKSSYIYGKTKKELAKDGKATSPGIGSFEGRHTSRQFSTLPAKNDPGSRHEVATASQRTKEIDEKAQAALRAAINSYLENTPNLFPGARRNLPRGFIKSIDVSLDPKSVADDLQQTLRSAFNKVQWAELPGVITIHRITVQPEPSDLVARSPKQQGCDLYPNCPRPMCPYRHPASATEIDRGRAEESCMYFPRCPYPYCAFKHPDNPAEILGVNTPRSCKKFPDCGDTTCRFCYPTLTTLYVNVRPLPSGGHRTVETGPRDDTKGQNEIEKSMTRNVGLKHRTEDELLEPIQPEYGQNTSSVAEETESQQEAHEGKAAQKTDLIKPVVISDKPNYIDNGGMQGKTQIENVEVQRKDAEGEIGEIKSDVPDAEEQSQVAKEVVLPDNDDNEEQRQRISPPEDDEIQKAEPMSEIPQEVGLLSVELPRVTGFNTQQHLKRHTTTSYTHYAQAYSLELERRLSYVGDLIIEQAEAIEAEQEGSHTQEHAATEVTQAAEPESEIVQSQTPIIDENQGFEGSQVAQPPPLGTVRGEGSVIEANHGSRKSSSRTRHRSATPEPSNSAKLEDESYSKSQSDLNVSGGNLPPVGRNIKKRCRADDFSSSEEDHASNTFSKRARKLTKITKTDFQRPKSSVVPEDIEDEGPPTKKRLRTRESSYDEYEASQLPKKRRKQKPIRSETEANTSTGPRRSARIAAAKEEAAKKEAAQQAASSALSTL